LNYIATLRAQLDQMAIGFVAALPSIVIALVILLVTWIVARFAARIADMLVGRSEMRPSLRMLIDTLVRLSIWIVGIMLAAVVVMPGLTPASVFAGLGIGAVAIGFAFQDIFQNFLAGVLIMIRRKMQVGDVIECEGICGRVEFISLRESHIRALSNELTIVPNATLFKNPVKILTDDDFRRHEIVVGVAYDTDLDRAADVIRRAMEKITVVEQGRGVEVYAQEFNASSIDFLVRWWSGSTPKASWESKDKAVRAIKRALDDAGIEIPFPYITHTFKEPVVLSEVRKK